MLRMIVKITTMARIAINAPWTNFVTRTTMSTVNVRTMPKPLIARAERERDEDADDVQLDQPRHLCVERPDEHHRPSRQRDDAVRVSQPVTTGVQLAGQETVAGQDRAEHREAVE